MQTIIKAIDSMIFHLKLEKLQNEKIFNIASKKLNTDVKQLMRGLVASICLFVCLAVFIFAHELVFWCLYFLYPTYATARTFMNEDIFSKEGKLWTSYWICFALVSILYPIFGTIFEFMPLFGLIKFFVVILAYHPKVKGAHFIVDQLMKPLLHKHLKETTNIEAESKNTM